MTKRMLIDSTHAEETRVVVLDGTRLEDFDVETAAKAQLKGNIYLAKVVRVEPSLQAAFVEYGGGRHGFLAFGEIHPDYYQIPVADRQRLLEMQEAEARAEEEAEDAAAEAAEAAGTAPDTDDAAPFLPSEDDRASEAAAIDQDIVYAPEEATDQPETGERADGPELVSSERPEPVEIGGVPADDETTVSTNESASAEVTDAPEPETATMDDEGALEAAASDGSQDEDAEPGSPAEARNGSGRHESRPPARFMRSYKIQEVIRRRQILLVQVVKEERGTKGAALTTFISLAGRFCVLMPNSPRGGGISRKITSAADRRRLKEVTSELQIPRGMGLIVRTAGAARPKAEIKRDCEYLLELWDSIRESTMASIAPALIHEEANLIKRAIRDNYSRDVEEVLVDGEQGWRAARDFMRMLMPAHARKVILWNEPQPLFARHGVEAQLDSMLQPTVQLRSGGYLVINQTEALVAIDVNSGRSTRERGIEETALKTNLEAADEVARQLRLRDLAGLVVIDFIDMESRRNNAIVEKRMKEALRDDRARIQLGSISHFGLMELSRQRLRPSLTETSFTTCPHCGGSGLIRTTETAALAVLRAIEEEGAKRRAAGIIVHVAGSVALYVLNHKRARLAEIEQRYAMTVTFAADESLLPPQTRIERTRPQTMDALPAPVVPSTPMIVPPEDDLAVEEADEDEEAPEAERPEEPGASADGEEDAEGRRRKRRRRRRGGRRDEQATDATEETSAPDIEAQPELDIETVQIEPQEGDPAETLQDAEGVPAPGESSDEVKSRRRGRRGGRRRRKDGSETDTPVAEGLDDQPSSFDTPVRPAYTGPTPANPFGGQDFDIFDILDEPNFDIPERPASSETQEVQAIVDEARPEESTQEAAPAPEAEFELGTEAVAAPETAEFADVASEKGAAQEEESSHAEATSPPIHAPVEAEPESSVNAAVPPPLLVGSETPAEKKRGWWRR